MKTGEKIAIIVVILCTILFFYLGYIEVKAEIYGKSAENNMCGSNETQIAGYCQQ